MADLKISQLTAIATIADADLFAIVDVSATETKKGTYLQLKTALAADFALPANEIGVGNGTAIISYPEFTWENSNQTLTSTDFLYLTTGNLGVEIDQATNQIITIGDVNNDYNNTTLKVDVANHKYIFNYPNIQIDGGNYTFPASIGAAGTVLTDAAGDGVLSWAAAGGGSVPSGTDGQTLYYNGTTLTATSNLINDGTDVIMQRASGEDFFIGSPSSGTYAFGDIEGYLNGTDMIINDTAQTISFNANNGTAFQGDVSITGNISATNLSGTNTGDQTSIVGISGTKAQFDTACSDGNFLFVGDVTGFTNELAQDAIGAMVDTTLVYVDATPLLTRAALTGDVTAAQGSNATTIANDAVTFAKMQNITSDRLLGRDTASSGDVEEISLGTGLAFSGSQSIVPFGTAYTMLANNTNASAAMTLVAFEDHNFADYGGTLSWNGTPPATIISQKYAWSRIGNTVTLLISVFYTSVGTTNTSAILTMPSDCPNPAVFAEAGDAASEYMYPISGARVETNMTGNPSAIRGGIRRNSGNSAFEIALTFGSVAALQLQVTVIYRTA